MKRGRTDMTHVADVLDVAAYHLVHEFPGGAPAMAKRIGMPAGVLQNKADPQIEDVLNIKHARAAMLVAKDFGLLEALAAECGFVLVPLETFGATGDVGLLEQYAKLDHARGVVGDEIHKALLAKNISKGAVKHIRKASVEEIKDLEGLIARLDACAEPEGKR